MRQHTPKERALATFLFLSGYQGPWLSQTERAELSALLSGAAGTRRAIAPPTFISRMAQAADRGERGEAAGAAAASRRERPTSFVSVE